MKTIQSSNKVNSAEIKLYEFLGIRLFKKAVFLFERIRHINDNGRNENYHLKDTSYNTIRKFSGYLIYNAMFHIVSLFFVLIYLCISLLYNLNIMVLDVVMIVIAVIDAYCLMLQRYTYLRIKLHINRSLLTKNDRLEHINAIISILNEKSEDEIKKEFDLIRSIRVHILSGREFVLSSENAIILSNIAVVYGETQKRKSFIKEEISAKETLSDLIDLMPSETRVISTTQQRVSSLQRALRISGRDNILFGFCLITDSGTSEAAYQKLFTHSTIDVVSETIDVLFEAYKEHQEGLV